MNTAITKLLGIKTPIISAPMGFAAGGALAGSVTAAGGFGFIGAVFANLVDVSHEIELARQKLTAPSGDTLPIGVGVITWGVTANREPGSDKWSVLDIAIENKVKAFWFSFGDAGEQISYLRKKSPEMLIFAQVQHVNEALIAVKEWKVDVLVVQGSEAGGHGAEENLTTFTLVPRVIAALDKESLKVPILAAGGVTTGQQLVAALALGADGVVVGTGFHSTHESNVSPNLKNALQNAKDENATIRTDIYDKIFELEPLWTAGWPKGVNGRILKNAIVPSVQNPSAEEVKRLNKEWKKAVREDDVSKYPIWAGQGVGLINATCSAAEVVQKMTAEAQTSFERLTHAKL